MKNDNVKNVKGGILWDFQTSNMFQNIKNMKRGPFGTMKKNSKKVSVPKKTQIKNTKISKGRSSVVFEVLDEILMFPVCFG